jgi:hypothetical protein
LAVCSYDLFKKTNRQTLILKNAQRCRHLWAFSIGNEMEEITAVVMVGEKITSTSAVSWVQGACRAAAQDLIEQLGRQPLIARIIVVSPDAFPNAAVEFVQSPVGKVHVGEWLAQLVVDFAIDRLFYAGGGSAPLLADKTLSIVLEQVAIGKQLVVTNNKFGSDWAGIMPAFSIQNHIPHLPRDNMLGWVLSTEGNLTAQTLPASAETRLDIDTPTDLLTLRLHPKTKPHLRNYLATLPLDTTPYQTALDVLQTPAKHVFIAGRLNPNVWQAVNRVSQCWVRVLAEERGMVSSGREARGEVYSLLAAQLEAVGIDKFFADLARWADLALIDSRVLLAHRRLELPASDRFASDLGHTSDIENEWLRAFTFAAENAGIPCILGGHSLMSGNLLAFCDLIER